MNDAEAESVAHRLEVPQIVGHDRKLVCESSCGDPHIVLIHLILEGSLDATVFSGHFMSAWYHRIATENPLHLGDPPFTPSRLFGTEIHLANRYE